MTLAHPQIKTLLANWQKLLRGLTNDSKVNLYARSTHNPEIEINKLITIICKVVDMSPEILISKSRQRERVLARQIICYYARNMRLGTFKAIGEKLGGKDHTTVIHAVDTIKDLIAAKDPVVLHLIGKIEKEIADYETSVEA